MFKTGEHWKQGKVIWNSKILEEIWVRSILGAFLDIGEKQNKTKIDNYRYEQAPISKPLLLADRLP